MSISLANGFVKNPWDYLKKEANLPLSVVYVLLMRLIMLRDQLFQGFLIYRKVSNRRAIQIEARFE